MKYILLFLISTAILAIPSLKDIDNSFNDIAKRYDIPADILKVVAYKKSGWMVNNLKNRGDNGEYGIMGLSMNEINLGISILGKYEPIDAIIDYKKNIEIFSAILVAYKNNYYNYGIPISQIEDYSSILVEILYPKNELLSKNFVRKIYNNLRTGYEVTYQEEAITVDGKLIDIIAGNYPEAVAFYKNYTQISSLDDVEFDEAIHKSDRNGTVIDQVIIHVMLGYFESTINMWKTNSNVRSSAHYLVSREGELVQMVKLEDKAWHAGTHNRRSIGIEHEGFWYSPRFRKEYKKTRDNYRKTHTQAQTNRKYPPLHDDTLITEAEYQASAMITRWLAERYNIPLIHRDAYHASNGSAEPYKLQRRSLKELSGILGHHDTNGKENCPGGGWDSINHVAYQGGWDWDYYMSLLTGNNNNSTGTLTLLTPINNETVDNPVTFRSDVSGDVVNVKYFADNTYLLGESSNKLDNHKVEYHFNGIGTRHVSAKGYDSQDRYINGTEIKIDINIIEAGEGTVKFIQPLNNGESHNPVIMKSEVTGAVKKVKYYAEGHFLLGESNNNNNNFKSERAFNYAGNRILVARGYDSNDIYITGAEEIIHVKVLERQSCNDICSTLNEKRCSENSIVEKCLVGDNGCKNWITTDSCNSNQTCENGICIENGSCNQCNTINEKRCSGNTIQKCVSKNSCNVWKDIDNCSRGKSCENGSCVEKCENSCYKEDMKRCLGQTIQICKSINGCLNWQNDIECSGENICDEGVCVENCENKCTLEEKRCVGNIVEICKTNFDLDSCTEWGKLSKCNNECNNGECSDNLCNKGEKYCQDEKVVLICSDNEKEYQFFQKCPSGELCSDGNCIKKISNKEEFVSGSAICNYSNRSNNSLFLLIFLLGIFIFLKRKKIKR